MNSRVLFTLQSNRSASIGVHLRLTSLLVFVRLSANSFTLVPTNCKSPSPTREENGATRGPLALEFGTAW